MVIQLKFAIMAIVAYLSVFGLAHVIKDGNRSGGKPSLMDFLDVDDQPPSLARYQLFPRDGILTVTVTNNICAPVPSQSSNVDSSTAISSTSPGSYISSLPSIPATPVPSSSSVSSSTFVSPSSSPVTGTPSSSSHSGTSIPSSTTPVKSTASSSVVSPSSPLFSSVSSPVSQPSSQFTGSVTAGDPTTTASATSTSANPPPQQGIASRQARVRHSSAMLLVLINVLIIHGFGNVIV